MSDFEAVVLADLSVLKNQMMALMEGPSGRLPLLEADVTRHDVVLERAKGFAGAFGLLFTIAHVLVEWAKR